MLDSIATARTRRPAAVHLPLQGIAFFLASSTIVR